MESEGYLLLPGFMNPKKLRDTMEPFKKKTEHIFNGEGTNDKKRRQTNLPNTVVKELKEQIQYLPFLTNSHKINDFVLLRSLPGCSRQLAHTDYIPDTSLLQCEAEKIPYLFLYALEDETHLIVWPGSHKVIQGRGRTIVPIQPTKITLQAGDALVFRADLVHAGSEYENENIRIHCYIDSKDVYRHPNRTWIIRKHTDDLVQKKIIE